MSSSKFGFTLLELLVVIGIIGILAALSLPNLMSARSRARDAERKSDLVQIQKALELYKLDHQAPISYPDSLPVPGSPWESDLDPNVKYMNKMPGDPSWPYYYTVDNSALTYTLGACLENGGDSDASDCGDIGYDCSIFTSGKCYILNEP